MNLKNIRNFAIIAHVDHGKSTLADRFLEATGVVEAGSHDAQMLDHNPISRERGITIKLAPVRMKYTPTTGDYLGEEFVLNLIDTPGHVDFSYEFERTLACVEGAILLVDATQGVQAQTIAHLYKAIELGVKIIPVVNKIDLPHASVEDTINEIIDLLSCGRDEIQLISAKTGIGVLPLLESIVTTLPSPAEHLLTSAEPRVLIFDSYYDSFRGVIAFVRVFGGKYSPNTGFTINATAQKFMCSEVGYFTPELLKTGSLESGEIGYLITGLKDIALVRVGDTIVQNSDTTPLPGYKPSLPMVFHRCFQQIQMII